MNYVIYTNTENLFKTISKGIIRIPKNLMDRFNLKRLKINDIVFLYNFEDEKLYGLLRVISSCYKEKNPRLGPFNGYGKVKNHYYYYSINVDCTNFWKNGLSIESFPELNPPEFIIKNTGMLKKIIQILKLLNTVLAPLLIEPRYFNGHFIISVLNVTNRMIVVERDIEIDNDVIELVKKRVNDLQRVINVMNYDEFLLSCKNIGAYIYEIIFKYLELDELFKTGGYSISIIPDDTIADIPLEFMYCCGSFLFEKNYINYFRKNKSELNREIFVNRALIIADPARNYRWSYEEGKKLYEFFLNRDIKCDFISRPISDLDFMGLLENYQLVHITGHGEIQRFESAVVHMFDIGKSLFQLKKISSLKKLPSFLFFNICSSSIKWGLDLLKNNEISTIILSRWNFPDIDGFNFILNFYELLLNGLEIGKVFGTQKLESLNHTGKNNILPLLFSHLGDANIKYVF